MNCIQTYVQTQSLNTITEPVNGSWIQAYAEYIGLVAPVNDSWLQAICEEFGITAPLFGSWTIALANYYGISNPDATWWCAIAQAPYVPPGGTPPFIWNLDTRVWEAETRVWAVAPAYDVDAQAFFTAVEGGGDTLTTDEKDGTNTLVVGLKSAGIWTKLKAFYPLVGGTITSQKWNLMNPLDTDAAFRLTFDNPGSFTFNAKGWKQAGLASQVANTYLNTATELTATDFSMGCSIYEATTTGNYYDMGNYDGAIENALIARYGASSYLNLGGGFTATATSLAQVETSWIVDSGGTPGMWRDGVSYITYGSGLQLASFSMGLGASNRSGVAQAGSDRGYTMFYIGESLNASALIADFTTLINSWQVTLGKTP